MNREGPGSGGYAMCFRVFFASLALLLGCSDFECPDGQSRVDGACPPAQTGPSDPDARTKRIPMACTNNLTPPVEGGPNFTMLEWELTVDPGRMPSGERFAVEFKAFAGFNEFILNGAQEFVGGGVSRLKVEQLRATVLIRRGADDPDPVALTLGPSSLPWTCRYDESGNVDADPSGRLFPSCSPDNTNPDGSNDGCTGLGGETDPNNPCGQFADIPVSYDCTEGGFCDSLGQRWRVWEPALTHCQDNGYCVKGPLEVELVGEDDGFVATDLGYVLFGFDDVNTGA
ncbi:MAG: hypothetical protein OER77_13850, partial [Myxococcales bacterium]|nr:hypothetical protein [Myxococcales bacterium]